MKVHALAPYSECRMRVRPRRDANYGKESVRHQQAGFSKFRYVIVKVIMYCNRPMNIPVEQKNHSRYSSKMRHFLAIVTEDTEGIAE